MDVRLFFKENKSLILILLSAFLIRLILCPYGTLEIDFSTFVAWSNRLIESGFSSFYGQWSDYTPGYLYLLFLLAKIKLIFPFLGEGILLKILYKVPAIIADLATGLLIFLIVKEFDKKLAPIASAFYLLNPAIFANSAMWGQVDGITTLFALIALYFAVKRPIISALALAFGTLVKLHAIFVAPIIFIIWLKEFGWFKSLTNVLLCVLTFIVGFIPFAAGKPIFSFIIERLTVSASQYQYTSVNAFNAWAIIPGIWKPDIGWPYVTGIIVCLGLMLFILWVWLRGKRFEQQHYFVAALFFLIPFLFLTRMHERHLLLVFAPLIIAAMRYSLLKIPYIIMSITYVVNLRFAFVWITEEFRWIFPTPILWLFALLNILALGLMIFVLIRPSAKITKFYSILKRKRKEIKFYKSNLVENYSYLFLIFILVFSILAGVALLGKPSTFYFDEVYHAFTAREILNGNPEVWIWFGSPPEGFAYAWDHPPLAKLGMVAGMWIFGETPIGWRLPGVLLGVLCIFFVYLIANELFKNKTIGVLGSAIFALSGLPLALSRIGMNDIYFLFFALGTIYFFLREKHVFSAMFFGLAAASKWSAIWIPPILVAIILINRKKIDYWVGWYIIIPPLVYFASYIPFFTTGHTFSQFIHLQQQMYWYHSRLEATHPFTSPWWSWPLMLKPVWMYTKSLNGTISNIYATGNPIVFWLGVITVILSSACAFLTKQKNLCIGLAAYFMFFVPWAFSPRIMFIYHYLPSVPFLSILMASTIMSTKHWKKIVVVFFILAVIFFVFMYPRFIGLPVSLWFNDWYSWLPT